MLTAFIIIYAIIIAAAIVMVGMGKLDDVRFALMLFWPATLAVCIASSPFYGLWRLGRHYREKVSCKVCKKTFYYDDLFLGGVCSDRCHAKWLHEMMQDIKE